MNKNSTNKFHLISFLKQPYPFYFQGKSLWIICSVIFLMSWSFNYLFEPFKVYVPEHKMDFFWICVVHGLTAAIVLLVLSLINCKYNKEENWTVKHEVIFITTCLLLIGIGEFLIRDIIYDNPNNWSFKYFFEEIRNTFMVGILFISIIVPLNFSRLNTKYIKEAGLLNTSQNKFKLRKNSKVEIQTNLKDDTIIIDINNLLFVKAEGNYVEFYLKENSINRIVKRITMKEIESVLSPYSNIIKTHRSFMVNLSHIDNVSGNAQGYKLYLKNFDNPVPVSRNMIENFNLKMKHH